MSGKQSVCKASLKAMQPIILCCAFAVFFADLVVLAHNINLTTSHEEIEHHEGKPTSDAGPVGEITEIPVTGLDVPSNFTTTGFGTECTISSVEYPDKYLIMESGYFHYYPILKKINPKPKGGTWDWRGIWKIDHVYYLGETHFKLWNHKTETFMTYKGTRYPFVRGTRDDKNLDNFWFVKNNANGAASTIQHAQNPNEFLHVLNQSATIDSQPVAILPYTPIKNSLHWNIHCD